MFGVLFFEATKSPFIDRNQGTRDQQRTTRRVGVGYSRKLTLSTLMMFILFTSFFRFEKKTIPATQKSSGIRDSTSRFGLARFEPFLWPILGKSPHNFFNKIYLQTQILSHLGLPSARNQLGVSKEN